MDPGTGLESASFVTIGNPQQPVFVTGSAAPPPPPSLSPFATGATTTLTRRATRSRFGLRLYSTIGNLQQPVFITGSAAPPSPSPFATSATTTFTRRATRSRSGHRSLRHHGQPSATRSRHGLCSSSFSISFALRNRRHNHLHSSCDPVSVRAPQRTLPSATFSNPFSSRALLLLLLLLLRASQPALLPPSLVVRPSFGPGTAAYVTIGNLQQPVLVTGSAPPPPSPSTFDTDATTTFTRRATRSRSGLRSVRHNRQPSASCSRHGLCCFLSSFYFEPGATTTFTRRATRSRSGHRSVRHHRQPSATRSRHGLYSSSSFSFDLRNRRHNHLHPSCDPVSVRAPHRTPPSATFSNPFSSRALLLLLLLLQNRRHHQPSPFRPSYDPV